MRASPKQHSLVPDSGLTGRWIWPQKQAQQIPVEYGPTGSETCRIRYSSMDAALPDGGGARARLFAFARIGK